MPSLCSHVLKGLGLGEPDYGLQQEAGLIYDNVFGFQSEDVHEARHLEAEAAIIYVNGQAHRSPE